MASTSHSPPTIAFPALNGMRGLAAVAVAVFHAVPLLGHQLAPGGYLAVDLFFVLSGCVIAHAYSAKLDSGMSVFAFMKVRLVRVAPFYMLGLFFGLALALTLLAVDAPSAMTKPYLALAVICGLLFLPLPITPNGVGVDIFPLNAPSWSLFYELVVNALFALCFRWLTPRVLVVVAVLSATVLVPGVWIHGDANVGPALHDAPLAFARALFSFVVGVLLYEVRRPVRTDPAITIAGTVVLLLVPVSTGWRPVFDLVCILFAFPVATFALVGARVRSHAHDRSFAFLGDASYGLYALHHPLIWLLHGAAATLGFNAMLPGVALLLALVIACAVVERRIDRPLRAWLTSRLVAGRT